MVAVKIMFDDLNPSQLEAVNQVDGPLLVLAGAGTGKTKVLTSRIANILSKNLVKPYNVLAVTFTNKAAKEMYHRVKPFIDSLNYHSLPNIGTFHSIATRILREHISKLDEKLAHNFTIIDANDQLKLVKSIALQKGVDLKSYNHKALYEIISRWKDANLLPHKLSSSDIQSPIYKIASEVYTIYQEHMRSSNSLDFGDLILYNNELFLTKPEVLLFYQEKFKYILIDEYQDTNAVQYLWVRMLADKYKNICCVGDDDQSIYGWRGADIANILRFEKDFPKSKVIRLEQNYRSTAQILSAANAIIKSNQNRHTKRLWTDREENIKIKIVYCFNDKEEARFISSEIKKLLLKYKAENIAILVRTSSQTRILEDSLMYNMIPYKVIGNVNFYERMEVRDVLAYIRIVVNHSDNLAFERIINVPKRSIGPATINLIKDYAQNNQFSLFDAISTMLKTNVFKNKTHDALFLLINQIEKWTQLSQSQSAFCAAESIINDSGYIQMLKSENTDEARSRIDNVNEMLKAIGEFEKLDHFIEHASLIMDHDNHHENFGGSVNLMTLHAAKGLEFNLVFLPGWEEGLFPHQRALNDKNINSLEEERRIAYVGITRAKDELYITFAQSRLTFGEITYSQPSRFLADIPKECSMNISSTQTSYNTNINTYNNKTLNKPSSYKSHIENKPHIQSTHNQYNIGSKVRHVTFGIGIIVRITEDNAQVAFQGQGIKTIKTGYLEL